MNSMIEPISVSFVVELWLLFMIEFNAEFWLWSLKAEILRYYVIK
jgi:hypothetical protein